MDDNSSDNGFFSYHPHFTQQIFFGGIGLLVMSVLGFWKVLGINELLTQNGWGPDTELFLVIGYGSPLMFVLGVILSYIGFKQWSNKKVWLQAHDITPQDQVYAWMIISSLVIGIPLLLFLVAYISASLAGTR